jgi:two-component system sensor histidine kinase/response regulator
MADEPTPGRTLVLSMQPAGSAERRWAAAAVLLSLAIFIAAVPFVSVKLPRLTPFIPCYEATLIINDLITAALLFGQFSIAQSRRLLVLASGFLFLALITVSHALTFPGLFSDTGLLGAGIQSTAWLYMFWHAGFPIAALYYAWLEDSDAIHARPSHAILASIAGVVALVMLLTVLATAGESLLPRIMQGNHYTPMMIFVVAAIWSLNLIVLITLLVRRPHSILGLWLMVVLCAWLCDIALSAVFNAGRFDLGFYVGRLYGMLAASFVLAALVLETVALYARLDRSLDAERQERELRLREMRSELIHVSRLSELGLMVSALAHEVNQPLTAVGNYLRATQRLVEIGETGKVRNALAKAVGEVTRASDIIRRLRDFIRDGDSEKRTEYLGTVIEETIELAVVATDRTEVGVDLRLDPQASMALINKVQIQQVLLNLIRNAVEAMAGRPQQSLVITTLPAADDMVELSVADSGPGLSPEVRAKLFQPFITTKSAGMGVGLSICHSIIEAHGGHLWAEDNCDGGAVFRFTVPCAQPQQRHAVANPAPPHEGAPGRVTPPADISRQHRRVNVQ